MPTTLKRHRYDKDAQREGMCQCGQGRGEDIHNILTWRKAPSGSWVTDLVGGVVWRCRSTSPGVWWPERIERLDKEGSDWETLGLPCSLALARKLCEQNREATE